MDKYGFLKKEVKFVFVLGLWILIVKNLDLKWVMVKITKIYLNLFTGEKSNNSIVRDGWMDSIFLNNNRGC